MPAADINPIDGYLRALDLSLAGPPRLKCDLLAEARDGLVDAAAAYREAGLAPAEADGRAVRDFGRLPDLAPAYQSELAAAAAQRLALWLTLIPLVLGAGSDLMWRGAPWTGAPPPAGYSLLSVGVDRFGSLLAAGGLCAYAWLAWAARRGRPVAPATARRVALTGLAGVTTLAAAGLTVFGLTVFLAPAALTWPPLVIGGLAMTAALGWLASRAWRCAAWAASPGGRGGPGGLDGPGGLGGLDGPGGLGGLDDPGGLGGLAGRGGALPAR
jgi:hypothetical protein